MLLALRAIHLGDVGRAGTALEGTIDLQKLAQTFPGIHIKMSDELGVQLVWDDGKPPIEDPDPPAVPDEVSLVAVLERYPIPDQLKDQVDEIRTRCGPIVAAYELKWKAWLELPTKEKAVQEFHDRIIRECMRANTESTETGEAKTEEAIQVALWKGPVPAQEV